MTQSWTAHSEDKAIEHTSSFLENIMKSLNQPEDAELSDKEDSDDEDKKKDGKNGSENGK